ncbi:MAG: MBL fold metallo-hydrolase [Candidatus Paceibacterota bacterium]|jgi:hypothetical protein
MIVNFYGQAFIKAQFGDTVVAFNPIAKESEAKTTRFGADLCLVSSNVPEANGLDSVTYANKIPFVVEGPGEYEKAGIFIRGISSGGVDGSVNTIYTMTLDGINICHLGLLKDPNLPAEAIEDLGSIDILFVPIGGGQVLDPKEAAKVVAGLEPSVIVPVMYDNDSILKTFLKEASDGKETYVDKLTVKRKDLDGKAGEVIVLKADI